MLQVWFSSQHDEKSQKAVDERSQKAVLAVSRDNGRKTMLEEDISLFLLLNVIYFYYLPIRGQGHLDGSRECPHTNKKIKNGPFCHHNLAIQHKATVLWIWFYSIF
jgi:hypothetical protein